MWYITGLPLASLLCGFLERDSSHIGQGLISRPIWIGAVLGACCRQLETGLWLGALFELLYMDALPIGVAVPSNGTVAAAVGTLCALSSAAIHPSLAFLYGWGWGRIHQILDVRMRMDASKFNSMLESVPPEYLSRKMTGLIIRWNFRYAILTAAFIYAASLLGSFLLKGLWAELVPVVRRSMEVWFQLLPFVMLSGALHLLKWNR